MCIYDEEVILFELIGEIYEETKTYQYKEDYFDLLVDEIITIIYAGLDASDEECEDIYFYTSCFYYYNNIPIRSIFSYDELELSSYWVQCADNLHGSIARLRSIDFVEQKSIEWLQIRQNMLSASNIYKAFKSPATLASLIKEKCAPMIAYNPSASIYNPMGWGIMFEPVSVKLYEYIYDTEISLFGCIPHSHYSFLGASPDGVNTKEENARFGRLLEIKNIYNREIDGIPSEEYWTQMQLQMEVCDFPLCDFLETRFRLYDDQLAFIGDDMPFKGIILETMHGVEYIYLWQFDYMDEALIVMNNKVSINTMNGIHTNVHYWYLDEWSCVLVPRNRGWFNSIFPTLLNAWDCIIEERNNPTPLTIDGGGGGGNICVIKMEDIHQ